MKKNLLTLIVTTNGKRIHEFDRFLLSISKQSFQNFEIILVLQDFNKNQILKKLLFYELFSKTIIINTPPVTPVFVAR